MLFQLLYVSCFLPCLLYLAEPMHEMMYPAIVRAMIYTVWFCLQCTVLFPFVWSINNFGILVLWFPFWWSIACCHLWLRHCGIIFTYNTILPFKLIVNELSDMYVSIVRAMIYFVWFSLLCTAVFFSFVWFISDIWCWYFGLSIAWFHFTALKRWIIFTSMILPFKLLLSEQST